MGAESLATSFEYTRIVSYVNVGSIAILVFDSFLTFSQEVEAIWSAGWSYMKIMYFLTRYSAFLEAVIIIYHMSIPGEWYGACALSYKINAWLFVLGLGVGEIIMTTRTWVVWNKNVFLTYTLPIFYVVVWAGGFVFTGRFIKGLKFGPDLRTPYVGCHATHADAIIFIAWVLLLFYDTVMFVLMVIPALKAYRSRGTPHLLNVVYRDGVLYYLYLYAISLVNIIVALTFPLDLILVISLLSRMIHAILACRIVLDIHECYRTVFDSPHNNQHSSNFLPTSTASLIDKRSIPTHC